MRVLAATQPAIGHLHPVVPLLTALQEQGHDVTVISAPSFRSWVEQAGLRFEPGGLDWREAVTHETFPETVPLRSDPHGALRDFMLDLFTRRTATATAASVAPLIATHRPDLVLHTKTEFGAAAAAEAAGVAHLPVFAGLSDWFDMFGPFLGGTDDALAAVGAAPQHGDPAWLFHHGLVLIEPLGWSAVPAGLSVQRLRPVPFDASEGSTARDPASAPRHPMVHVTLGTVFNKFPGLFEVLVAGTAPHAADVLVTVGSNLDASAAGPVPVHVRVERYVPLSQILTGCDLVVAHAGWNTLMACGAAGVPVVALVVGADHQGNADAGAAAGWVLPLAARGLTAPLVGEAVQRALADTALREAALRCRSALEALPSPTDVASDLANRFGH